MRSTNLGRLLADKSGFTLIELLGVAVILIILAVMSLPVYAEVTDRAREGKTQEQLRIIEQALEAYRADATYGGHYPNTLPQLVERGFLKPGSFETPWSSPDNTVYYYYAVDRAGAATHYVLGDAGPGVACPALNRCDEKPDVVDVDPNLTWAGPAKLVRRSH